MITNEEKKDLLEDLQQVTYQYLTLSGVNGNMSNESADELANEWAAKIDAQLHSFIDDEFEKMEAAAERAGREAEKEAA